MGAFLPVAAAAIVRDKGATVASSVPVVWHALGYPFEAGSMIAALCACAAVRFYVVQTAREQHRWTIDMPVTILAMMFTAGAVLTRRPEPLEALMTGTGIGALGAGIITIALSWVRRNTPSFDDKPVE
ncbi:hypothetical protein GGQ80_002106 [Sphingomonas jinjuensis]|uniref:Uncharacterized protein n=1 Tax=Sphingomonas jinjuensis TaxID=535907 RepID=A0A840FD69_9SPHN|nr:hypothetical protein [Sphingomonas jinjuensis]MBB4154196.1 hypothetical protein [Sphingomonas jinjuensis]